MQSNTLFNMIKKTVTVSIFSWNAVNFWWFHQRCNPWPMRSAANQNEDFLYYLDDSFSHVYLNFFRNFNSIHVHRKASSNLLYGGKILGEAAMKYLEDIGNRVIHMYEIDNNGQWDLTDVKVNINWPSQVSPGMDRMGADGKWLLYLESVPTVTGKVII